MSFLNKKDEVEETPLNPFLGFTIGVYNFIITIFAVFIAWVFYSDVFQHLGYEPISFLYFYFSYMLLSCIGYLLKSPSEILSILDRSKEPDYKSFTRYYPTLKAFVVALSYGFFKLVEWIFV